MAISLAVFGAGLLAGFLNVMAGGGSLLTLPILLFLGFPAALANGTNRVAILAQNVTAVASFRRQGLSDVRTGAWLALLTLPGAVAGAIFAIRISEAAFRTILAAVLVLAVWGLFAPRRGGREVDSPLRRMLGGIAFVGIGFYGGFIQAGVGFLLMAALYSLLAVDLVRVNMYKVFIVLVYTLPALTVFVWSGNVDWSSGLVLAVGNSVGALVATRVSVKGGERPIRVVLAVALLLMAGRLVW